MPNVEPSVGLIALSRSVRLMKGKINKKREETNISFHRGFLNESNTISRRFLIKISIEMIIAGSLINPAYHYFTFQLSATIMTVCCVAISSRIQVDLGAAAVIAAWTLRRRGRSRRLARQTPTRRSAPTNGQIAPILRGARVGGTRRFTKIATLAGEIASRAKIWFRLERMPHERVQNSQRFCYVRIFYFKTFAFLSPLMWSRDWTSRTFLNELQRCK